MPAGVLAAYHHALALLGALRYGFPSRHLLVIGVTGTRGKTTTANYLWAILTAAGHCVGLTGTANIRIGAAERMNEYHMTMPGRFVMQRLLAEMRRAGCEIAIIETPSEGIEQHRDEGIAYDALVLTSLYPEYLEAHGWSYERLIGRIHSLFVRLASLPPKTVLGRSISKMIAVNAAIPEKDQFLAVRADKKITYATQPAADLVAANIQPGSDGVTFSVNDDHYALSLVGSFNVENALGAMAVAKLLGVPDASIRAGLESLRSVPGRMERIPSSKPFTVFVDYAHDGPSIAAALRAARELVAPHHARVIILLGGEGGGRDKRKRPVMGELVGREADLVIVSNVDPYDDDPVEIIEDIARAAESVGKVRGSTLFAIEPRRAGIRKALELAAAHDVVLVTGKGAEQSMILGPKTIPWDDRVIVREELEAL